ncbi:MAG: YifB family Mg chelatase-like AAA ATPase [Actinomycetota bacterium]|nr:YifB family Mg chelatase-like AAA ATPase [Actinomycetota bacterium]
MDARPVEVEVHLGQGLPDFHLVGLPSVAIREARRRVRSAVMNSEEAWPQRRITANLAPGDLRKDGVLFDLPLALGVLAANGRIGQAVLSRYMFIGELALDGRVRPVRGALAAALTAKERGYEGLVVPKENAYEAALVPGPQVVGVGHLTDAVAFLTGKKEAAPVSSNAAELLSSARYEGPDFSEVRGQALAVRALEIAAVGGHNVLMVGPPGCGKTMLAERLPGILPPLSEDEAMETTRVWSVAGLLGAEQPMVVRRPFRAPHHHASAPAIIGGGSPVPRPGEISLAHHGVLFLDELPLFSRSVLEALREPLEQGRVTVARQGVTATFPASVCLVAAANPCVCGRFGDPAVPCDCPPPRLDSYRSRLSGPLLDRIDLHVEVPRLTEEELYRVEPSETSAAIRGRVVQARDFRLERQDSCGDQDDRSISSLDPSVRRFLRRSAEMSGCSARGLTSVLRVARSIADLAQSAKIEDEHVAEAIQYRRSVWRTS